MDLQIAHRIPGRTRFTSQGPFTINFANKLKYYIEKNLAVSSCKIYPITGSLTLEYNENHFPFLCKSLLDLDLEDLDQVDYEDPSFIQVKEKELFHIIRDNFQVRLAIMALPQPMRIGLTLFKSLAYIKSGLKALGQKKLNVDVLDMTAIVTSLMSQDFQTASSIMFLLHLGEEMEDWTLKKSKEDLTRSLAIQVDKVFVKEGDQKIEKPLKDVQIGDQVYVHMGHVIPVDGIVLDGLGMVNQSSLTGESLAIPVQKGRTVYASTVLEEGNLLIETKKKAQESRIQEIVALINDSENKKSKLQVRAESRADGLVKYSFLGALLSYALTRNMTIAKSFLMVDFSCALKLTMPIAVMKAMSQASRQDVLVKGGKYLEDLAQADAIVFDKTGTLTYSQPRLVEVHSLNKEYTSNDCLKIAACLEEHFPHSIANAVVEGARQKGIVHEEMHSEPQYIVAHGISALIDGKLALIGSKHFIFEDEKVPLTPEIKGLIEERIEDYSLLYLAYDGKLLALLCIEDPLREDAYITIQELRDLGIKKIVLLTGDADNAARSVAEKLDLDDYRSQVLPEDKAAYIDRLKDHGYKVVMVGDGINDSLAMSRAHVSLSMHKGADLAKEVADLSIASDDLKGIGQTIRLARAMIQRMEENYRKIIAFNSALIGLSAFQILTNTQSSLLHNTSTVLIAGSSMKDYQLA